MSLIHREHVEVSTTTQPSEVIPGTAPSRQPDTTAEAEKPVSRRKFLALGGGAALFGMGVLAKISLDSSGSKEVSKTKSQVAVAPSSAPESSERANDHLTVTRVNGERVALRYISTELIQSNPKQAIHILYEAIGLYVSTGSSEILESFTSPSVSEEAVESWNRIRKEYRIAEDSQVSNTVAAKIDDREVSASVTSLADTTAEIRIQGPHPMYWGMTEKWDDFDFESTDNALITGNHDAPYTDCFLSKNSNGFWALEGFNQAE